jgi:hypothetical protein
MQRMQGVQNVNINKTFVYPKLMQTVLRIAFCGVFGAARQVLANEMPDIESQRFVHWERASDSELDLLRGGFMLPNGMSIDFSIQRIISLNNEVILSSFSQLPSNITLIQNGDFSQAPALGMAGLGTVIQNNLDNQTIKSLTNIDLTVSNIKSMQLNSGAMVFNSLIMSNR